MNSKILKAQNSNKKKLLIIKSTKENLEEVPENILMDNLANVQRQLSHQYGKNTMLPSINMDNKSHISISLPTERTTIRRKGSLASSSKLSSVSSKVKPSSFFCNYRLPNLKIEEIVTGFIEHFEKRGIFNMHFGKYLIQPKSLFHTLLFALNSLNNSKNLGTFYKVISQFDNYEEMVRDLATNQFYFKFAVRNNKKMSFFPQAVDLCVENEYRINMEKQTGLLESKRQQLLKDILQMRNQKQSLEKCISDQQEQIYILNSEIRRLSAEISDGNDALFNLKNVIMQTQQICEKMELNRRHFSTLMVNFSENRYNQIAVAARRLEDDLIEYVEYLKFHPLGKRPFEKSKYVLDTEKMLGQEFQEFCKYLMGEHSPLDDKIRLMREFLLKAKTQFNTIISQLLIVISQKTDFILKFTSIITKWHQNYISRKSILAELSRSLTFEALNLEEVKSQAEAALRSQQGSERETKAFAIAEKILTLFRTAESFV